MIEYYTYDFLDGIADKRALYGIISSYFDGLSQTEDEELRKLNPKLVKFKRMLSRNSMDKTMFLDVEKNIRR